MIKKIKKRSGEIVEFKKEKIAKAIYKAMEAVGEPNYDAAKELSEKVVKRLEEELKDEIPTVEGVQDLVERTLVDSDRAKVAKEYILYREKRTEIRKQKQQILNKEEMDEVDKSFDINALRVLRSRYLKKDKKGNVIESPKELFKRVATHVALPSLVFDKKIRDRKNGKKYKKEEFDPEKFENKIKIGNFSLNRFHLRGLKRVYDRYNEREEMKKSWSEFFKMLKGGKFEKYEKEIKEYYNLMTKRKFLPNTPTLANFGNFLGMGSACFVLDIEDSIESIMDTLKRASIIFKSGGGVGYNFSKLRPEGDYVKSTGGIASGPVSFMRLFDRMTEVIKQGGIRRGANMGIMNINHPEIEKFITAKSGNEALKNFNISVFIKSDFWDYYEKNEPYPLVNPHTGEVTKHVDPKNLFDLIVYQAWESAEPGVIFEEHANRHNPMLEELGPITCTNPCVTEDTWVTTSQGPRKVKELIGEKTKVVVNGEKWHNKGNGFFKTGLKPVFRLETEEGFEVKLTEDHPVKAVKKLTRRVIESEWKKAKNLKPQEKIILNNHQDLGWDGKYSEREGYLMGYLVGDGIISGGKAMIDSWGENDGEKRVREVIETYAASLPHRKDFGGWTFTGEKYRLKIAQLTKIANKLGLDKRKKITPEIEKTSSSFYRGFLKGIFDADGSVQGNHEKGISIRLAQSDMEKLRGIQRMLLRLGIFSKIYKNRRKGGKQNLLVVSKENIFKFYKRIGFENTDKLEKLKKLLKNYKRSPNREKFVATFKKLKPIGKKEVYDIQVPGINAFDANGFYLHNCGEVLLYPYESCNLGSINVWTFANKKPTNGRKKDVKFDWEGLKKVVKTATKFLDNVVEVNNCPLEGIEEMTLKMRKIGLGIMGLGDLLYELEIPYNSEKGLKFMEKLMEFINYYSKIESIKLSKERGSFPLYEKSFYPNELPIDYKDGELEWDKIKEKIKKHGLRNAFTTVVAPTGSISMIGGCSSGIEPVFSLVFEKKVSVGSFYYVDPVFEKAMMRRGLFDDDLIKEVSKREGRIQNLSFMPEKLKKIFVTSMDIKAKDHINALASLQKWTDSSISKTINFPGDTTIKEMKEAYLYAYKMGCKDLTVFRNKSIKGVLEAGKTKKKGEKKKPKKEKKDKKLISLEDVKANGLSIYHEAGFHKNEENSKKCPSCESKIVNLEGCKKCLNCGWSACTT